MAKEPTAAQARQIRTLAQQMRDGNRAVASRAFLRLVKLDRGWKGIARARAALAIGYYDYNRHQYDDARHWFRLGRGDPVLRRYAVYWEGIAAGQAGQDAAAMALLGDFLRRYPHSVVEKPALNAFADAAIDGKQPQRAIRALRAYPGTWDSASLLLNLGLAREQAGDLADAAVDFQRVYDRFPLHPEAQVAGMGIDRVRGQLGVRFPEAPVGERLHRAETLYRNRHWRSARLAWLHLRGSLGGYERELADLRVAQCDVRLRPDASVLEQLNLPDPKLDAQRWMAVFNLDWDNGAEDQMKAAAAKVVSLASAGAPASMADEALFMMGNYYWVNLKLDKAADYYRQMLERHARSRHAVTANWRIAWIAYLEKKPETAVLLRSHIERYPDSPYVPDALYWLGRLAERQGQLTVARAYYTKLSTRFTETYFGRLARQQLEQLQAQRNSASVRPVLERIPPIPHRSSLDDAIPARVRGRYQRAQALRTIAFNQSAMLEFRAAYRIAPAPKLLIDAARAAQAANQYLAGAALVRLLVPDLESRPIDAVPASIWRMVYPLPFRGLIRRDASRYRIDPMLLASLIRQESGFQPDIVSAAGAVGLAQLMPFTALKWSRKLRLWYSRSRLVDPQYNLRVGGAYLQSLIQRFGSVEAALAAYNAGGVRVAQWLASRHFNSPAEFVESIPFSQTRNYVKVVMNGAVIYRHLYGSH